MSEYVPQITGSLVSSQINPQLEPDDPRLQLANRGNASGVDFGPGLTVTGDNVPACSRPYMNRRLDPETARVITRGRVARPNPALGHEGGGEKDTEVMTYEEAVAALKAKYGVA
jgi:hypothetical protein